MGRYDVVPERSQVWIEAKSSLHPIHSHTAGIEGRVEIHLGADGRVDPSAPPTARVSLPVDRLRSGNILEERELKRRISARQFPTIEGELTAIAPDSHDGQYVVTGTVTFRGETRAYEHEMRISRIDEHTLRFEGEAIFDVRDFGMEPPRILMLRVEPEVTVRVDIIAIDERQDT